MKKTILVLSLFFLNACVETVVAGAVATGVMLTREESVSDTFSDASSKRKIKKNIKQYDKKHKIKKYDDIDISVIEKRVLLTGMVRNTRDKKKLAKLVWRTKEVKVKEVINEVQISPSKSRDKVKDTWITSQIKTKFKTKMDIKSFNYDVITIDNTVYLFGIAQNTAEMRKTAKIASQTKGVKNVISHVILKYDVRRHEGT